ncbi:hypothetical protein GCM10011391_08930 [Pullulanibacillus camelliae]|uniref:Uncharacterized protein n=1 Tax=Pullulanibacillus camelliae TaxID=1707096 RepID=A0A8J2VNF9_9BACL|nr:hypothetical protein [Pullulanibacillus camelliae]GGE32461.1 hypothetical protein GCM10011391_08930 [Pullulanibacillus camelliae]
MSTGSVNQSGNAIVTVQVDTRPFAYAMLSSLYASGRFSIQELNAMLDTFQSLDATNGQTRFYEGENTLHNLNLYR